MFRVASNLARLSALLIVATLATACVSAVGAAPTGKPVKSDKVVFRVTSEGGFVMTETMLGRLPLVVVYADGRVITQGPQIAVYPGPLMPNLVEHTLSEDALARLIELAREKGLLKTVQYDLPGIADAPDTVLEINLDGKSYRVSAYALAEAVDLEQSAGLDPADVEGRRALREFIDALAGMPAEDFVDDEHPLAIEALRIYAGKAVTVPNSELPGEQPAVDWPLGDLATAGDAVENSPIDVRCQVVEGEDLATTLPLLQQANSLQTFRSEGEHYSLIVRPLLPGETGC